MVITRKVQALGGKAVVKKYGADYMRKLGKRGRRKQLQARVK